MEKRESLDCDVIGDLISTMNAAVALGYGDAAIGTPTHKHPQGMAAGKKVINRISERTGYGINFRGIHALAAGAAYLAGRYNAERDKA